MGAVGLGQRERGVCPGSAVVAGFDLGGFISVRVMLRHTYYSADTQSIRLLSINFLLVRLFLYATCGLVRDRQTDLTF